MPVESNYLNKIQEIIDSINKNLTILNPEGVLADLHELQVILDFLEREYEAQAIDYLYRIIDDFNNTEFFTSIKRDLLTRSLFTDLESIEELKGLTEFLKDEKTVLSLEYYNHLKSAVNDFLKAIISSLKADEPGLALYHTMKCLYEATRQLEKFWG